MKIVRVDNGIKLQVVKGIKGDGLVWRGEWKSSTTYANIDVVSRGGASWVSVKSNNRGNDPLTDDGTWWNCMVADSLAEGYRNEALTYRNEAEDFAESAASSAESAATSAANAAESAANAAESEENAATSAANAAASETNAAESAQNAATSEANAKTSELNAATSETNALESASNAYTSEMNAAASEDKAAKWAQEDENVEVEPGKYSAYHWALKAQHAAYAAEAFEDAAYASELLERLETMGGILI
jgi:flagellar biosynthesis GTPase FlhF